jgi:hypothetical protein
MVFPIIRIQRKKLNNFCGRCCEYVGGGYNSCRSSNLVVLWQMDNLDSQEELTKKALELAKLVRQCGMTNAPLAADLNFAIQQWQSDRQSQFWSRTSIRCLCASVEAVLFGFRKMAEQMAPLSRIQFDSREVEILSEIQVRDGVERPKWLPFVDSVKESFRLFGKSVKCPIAIDYGDSGFADLCGTFKVRNRLMHPKGPFDVQVTVEELSRADRAVAWFNRTFVSVIDGCRAHNHKIVEDLKGNGEKTGTG